jgi:hypothetical protein
VEVVVGLNLDLKQARPAVGLKLILLKYCNSRAC